MHGCAQTEPSYGKENPPERPEEHEGVERQTDPRPNILNACGAARQHDWVWEGEAIGMGTGRGCAAVPDRIFRHRSGQRRNACLVGPFAATTSMS